MGRELDAPLLRSTFVAEARHRHGITVGGHGRRDPQPPRWRGTLEDGRRASVELRLDGQRVTPFSKPTRRDDGTYRVSIPNDAPPGYLDDLLDKLGDRNGGKAHVIGSRPEGEATVQWTDTLHITTWPRYGAKVALILGSHVLGDAWLASPTAVRLRDALWDRKGEAKALRPLPERVSGDDPFARCFHPPEHVLYVTAGSHGGSVIVVLFGELLYGAPLGADVPTDDARAWVLDPIKPGFRALRFDDWVREVVAGQTAR